jgi:hypothetical protein
MDRYVRTYMRRRFYHFPIPTLTCIHAYTLVVYRFLFEL